MARDDASLCEVINLLRRDAEHLANVFASMGGRLLMTFGVGRPLAPMRRADVDACLAFRLDPAAKNAAARKGNCPHAI